MGEVAQVFEIIWNGEVRVMQSAEALLEIIHEQQYSRRRTLESPVPG